MKYANVAIIVVSLLVICLEFLWLYRLSKRQEADRKRKERVEKEIGDQLSLIFETFSGDQLHEEIISLKKYAENHFPGMQILCEKILGFTAGCDHRAFCDCKAG